MNQSLLRYLREHPAILIFGVAGSTVAAILLTLIPAEYIASSKVWWFDKAGHFLLFGSWTFMIGLYGLIYYPGRASIRLFFILGLLFGGIIELLQHFLPVNRNADLGDLLFDAAGSLVAVLLLKLIKRSS